MNVFCTYLDGWSGPVRTRTKLYRSKPSACKHTRKFADLLSFVNVSPKFPASAKRTDVLTAFARGIRLARVRESGVVRTLLFFCFCFFFSPARCVWSFFYIIIIIIYSYYFHRFFLSFCNTVSWWRCLRTSVVRLFYRRDIVIRNSCEMESVAAHQYQRRLQINLTDDVTFCPLQWRALSVGNCVFLHFWPEMCLILYSVYCIHPVTHYPPV